MARKSKTRSRRDDASGSDSAVRDSAQKIWLAGLGAFERAKTEGPRMFETLVEQGRNMGARAVGAADEALKSMRQANYTESISKSLSRLADELNDTVRRMGGTSASGTKRKASAGKRKARKKSAATGARKTARKRTAKSRKAKA